MCRGLSSLFNLLRGIYDLLKVTVASDSQNWRYWLFHSIQDTGQKLEAKSIFSLTFAIFRYFVDLPLPLSGPADLLILYFFSFKYDFCCSSH